MNDLFYRSACRKMSEYQRQHGFIELIATESGDQVKPTVAQALRHRARSVAYKGAKHMCLPPAITGEPVVKVEKVGAPLKHAYNDE